MNDLLFDLDEFEETRVEWEPIFEPSIESVGWHWSTGKSLPRHADETPVTKTEWNEYLASYICRDCAGPVKHDRGGADNGGWSLCHECGAIIDLPRWSRDRDQQTGHTLDELRARQTRRRADYLRKAVAA